MTLKRLFKIIFNVSNLFSECVFLAVLNGIDSSSKGLVFLLTAFDCLYIIIIIIVEKFLDLCLMHVYYMCNMVCCVRDVVVVQCWYVVLMIEPFVLLLLVTMVYHHLEQPTNVSFICVWKKTTNMWLLPRKFIIIRHKIGLYKMVYTCV